MSLTDDELRFNFYDLVLKYVEDNGGVGDDFRLNVDGLNVLTIPEWNYVFPRPNEAQLRAYSLSDINNRKNRRRRRESLIDTRLLNLTTIQRDDINNPQDGMMIFNETINRVEAYYSNKWNPL